jgi:tRNA/tmRNA/rRNA uracil-C5-methylase (TrmA/RlmC/RlmD family)
LDLEPHEAPAAQQGGSFYPWRAALGYGNGEDACTQLVEDQLSPDEVVLDAGCGYGTAMLAFAPKVRRFIGYEAVESFITIALRQGAEAGLTNMVHCQSQ